MEPFYYAMAGAPRIPQKDTRIIVSMPESHYKQNFNNAARIASWTDDEKEELIKMHSSSLFCPVYAFRIKKVNKEYLMRDQEDLGVEDIAETFSWTI